MRVLLSSSTHHFNPKEDENAHYHSTGLTIKVFYQALKRLNFEIDIINDDDKLEGTEYDLLISWPRNFRYLSNYNKFKKRICFLNAAEPMYLKKTLKKEAGRLGCKLHDCFDFRAYNDADLFFMLGGQFNRDRYMEAGVPEDKIVDFRYAPEEQRMKHVVNERPIFIHFATTLGLRKGFWWAVEDFKKADVDAELWCVGKVQGHEHFWFDYAKEAEKDPRVKVVGWIKYKEQEYYDILGSADFLIFPSFGEGQAGTVMESMAMGVIPLHTKESGVPYYPLGEYHRGDPSIIKKAASLTWCQRKTLFKQGYKELDDNYNNEYYVDVAVKEIESLIK